MLAHAFQSSSFASLNFVMSCARDHRERVHRWGEARKSHVALRALGTSERDREQDDKETQTHKSLEEEEAARASKTETETESKRK